MSTPARGDTLIRIAKEEKKVEKAASLYKSSRTKENEENKLRNFKNSVSTFIHKIIVLKIGTFVKYCYLK
jgi:hypothetical protein